MKRLLALLLAVVMLLSLCACGNHDDNDDDDDTCRHKWQDATCTEPKTCTKCGLTRGEANGHEWVYNDDVGLEICRNCVMINTDTPNEDDEDNAGNEGNDDNPGYADNSDDDDLDVFPGELLFEEPFYIECVTYSVADATRSNSEAVKAIRTATNVFLSYRELDDFDYQYTGILLNQEVPTLSFFWSNEIVPMYGPKGYFVDLLQHLHKMPNVSKFMRMYTDAFDDCMIYDEYGYAHMYALPVLSLVNGRVSGTDFHYTVGCDADIDKVCKFLDWMYSDVGVEVTNWGLRGEHYTVNTDGKKAYTPKMHKLAEEAETGIQYATCFGIPGVVAVIDRDAVIAQNTKVRVVE